MFGAISPTLSIPGPRPNIPQDRRWVALRISVALRSLAAFLDIPVNRVRRLGQVIPWDQRCRLMGAIVRTLTLASRLVLPLKSKLRLRFLSLVRRQAPPSMRTFRLLVVGQPI